MKRLIKILSHKRPAGSKTEQTIKHEMLLPYDPIFMYGNYVVAIPNKNGTRSNTLFSCHTDTVHSTEGTQKLVWDKLINTIKLDIPFREPMTLWQPGTVYTPRSRECLGADDGAGMWLMMEMIDAKVPGTYIFHHSEECGGLGSREMAKKAPEYLGKFKRAIAFDRRGTGDVINTQKGSRCCSDIFALELAGSLNDLGMTYKPTTGAFTDTANYTHLIPECTNLSCGYYNEHGDREYLDVDHLIKLRNALILLDWNNLPTTRNPKYVEPVLKSQYFGYTCNDDNSWLDRQNSKVPANKPELVEDWEWDELEMLTIEELEKLAWNDPDGVANILFTLLHPEFDDNSDEI